jgi:hypothetical protein
MISRTVADVRNELRRVAGQAGLRVDDDRILEIINCATEKLLSKVDAPVGSIHRLKFCQYGGLVALPSRYQRIIKSSLDREQTPVFDQWYEFLDFGPGHQDKTPNVNVLIDRGESPVIRTAPSTGWKVRVYGYADERVDGTRPKLRVFGYDEYNRWVRSEESGVWVDGEALEIDGDSATNYRESTNKFSRITQVSKPVTNREVELYYVDDYGTPLLAGRYDHWETNPSFRTYFAPGVSDTGTLIHALARVRFVPVARETDKLLITSLPALRKAVRAIAAEDKDEDQLAEVRWELAAQTLRDEAREYFGHQPKPALDGMKSGMGFGDISDVR